MKMKLDELWGPFNADCFATHYNKKVPKYFSRFWNPRTAGADAFFQNWEHENCLVVPPVVLLSKVLTFVVRICSVRGTLVVPYYWPSSPFWLLLVHKFWKFAVDYSFFEGRFALRQDRNTNSLLGSTSRDGLVLAVKVQFSRSAKSTLPK